MHTVIVALAEPIQKQIFADEDLKRLQGFCKVHVRPDLTEKPAAGETSAEDRLAKAINDTGADILITGWGAPPITAKLMEKAPTFKYLCHFTGELKWFVERAAIEKGLLVTNWGDCTAQGTAEGALAMTFAILRHYHLMVDWMRKDRLYWDTPRLEEGLFNQRVGLHGLGAIGQEYAKFLRPFNCRVSAYSPHVPDSVFESLGIRRVTSLEELYSTNRIISLHAAKTPANHHIVNAKLLSLIEDGGYFINTSRGDLVNEDDMAAELRKGRITAALDVYEPEPLAKESPLRDLPNCFCVPHRAGPTPDCRQVMGKHGVDNITRYTKGEPVTSVIDLRKYDLMT
jgi:phosphoglycerate dehydrogenase-like enzyme